jgi:hypothetical protein
LKRPVCLTVAANGYGTAYFDCLLSQRLYALRHGYGFVLADRFPWQPSPAQSSWIKLVLMKVALERGHDTAFFDADCSIRLHAPPFIELFNDGGSTVLVPGKSGRPNAGVIFARSTEIALRNIDLLLSRADEQSTITDVLWENAILIQYLDQMQDVRLAEHVQWNNNSHLNRQSYVQHYASGEIRELRERRPIPRMLIKLASLQKPPASSQVHGVTMSTFLREYALPYAARVVPV